MLSRCLDRSLKQPLGHLGEGGLALLSGLLAGVIIGEVTMAGAMLVHGLSILVVVPNYMRLVRI